MSAFAASDSELRYSVEILFSEALEFDLTEIANAVAEDYPDNMITVSPINPETSVSTDRPIAAMLDIVDDQNGKSVTLTGAGFPDETFRAADHTELAWRSGSFAEGALEAIRVHKSYLTLSIQVTDTSLAGRFRAARQLTAVSAVFAQLPIALGVLVHWSSHMVKPDAWLKAAQASANGEWPLLEWVSYRGGWDTSRGQQCDYAVAYTIGLSKFLDYEFHMEAAPIKPSDAIKMLAFSCWLPLQGGNQMRDGDTVGIEDSPLKYTMRRRKTADGTDDAIMVLLHPDSPVDEVAEFGPNPLQKAPDWYDNARLPKLGFMKKILGKPRTLH